MNVRHGIIGFGAVVSVCITLLVMQGCYTAVDYLGSDCPSLREEDCCQCMSSGVCPDEDEIPAWCFDGGTEGGTRR